MNLFNLFAKLTLDETDYKKALDNADTHTNSFVSGVESAGSKIGKTFSTIAGTVVKVGAAMTAGITALGAVGMSFNATIEQAETEFGVMLGSVEAGVKKVQELKDFAASTPFELGDLSSATKTLLAFGVANEDTTKVLSQLGDIALGDAQKLDTLSRAYGKMTSSQKVTLEDINMMIDSGFNPLNIVAENTGETMAELYDRISSGSVSVDEITAAFDQATSEGGQFFEGMKQGSQTTDGLISTLKDNVQSKLGEVFAGASAKLKEMLPKIIEWVNTFDTTKIVEFLSLAINKISEVGGKILEVLMSVDWQAVMNFITTAIQLFMDWMPIIVAIGAAVLTFYGYLKLLAFIDMVKNMVLALNAAMMANPIGIIIALIVGLVAAFVYLWNTSEEFREFWIGLWEDILAWVLNAADIGADIVKGIWDGIVGMGQWLTDQVTGFFSGIWNGVKSIFGGQAESEATASYQNAQSSRSVASASGSQQINTYSYTQQIMSPQPVSALDAAIYSKQAMNSSNWGGS